MRPPRDMSTSLLVLAAVLALCAESYGDDAQGVAAADTNHKPDNEGENAIPDLENPTDAETEAAEEGRSDADEDKASKENVDSGEDAGSRAGVVSEGEGANTDAVKGGAGVEDTLVETDESKVNTRSTDGSSAEENNTSGAPANDTKSYPAQKEGNVSENRDIGAAARDAATKLDNGPDDGVDPSQRVEGVAGAEPNANASSRPNDVVNPSGKGESNDAGAMPGKRSKHTDFHKRWRRRGSRHSQQRAGTAEEEKNDRHSEDGSVADAMLAGGAEGRGETEMGDVEYAAAECEVVGACLICSEDELEESFCQKTGRRQEVRCPVTSNVDAAFHAAGVSTNGAASSEGMARIRTTAMYRSCLRTEQEEVTAFAHFWVSMLVVGVLSCIGMRRRQQRSVSLYDRRAK